MLNAAFRHFDFAQCEPLLRLRSGRRIFQLLKYRLHIYGVRTKILFYVAWIGGIS